MKKLSKLLKKLERFFELMAKAEEMGVEVDGGEVVEAVEETIVEDPSFGGDINIELKSELGDFSVDLLGMHTQGSYENRAKVEGLAGYEHPESKKFLERIGNIVGRGLAGTSSIGSRYVPGHPEMGIGFGYESGHPNFNRFKDEEKHFVERLIEWHKAMPGFFKEYIWVDSSAAEVSECINAVKRLQSEGIVIKTIELGNEMHLKRNIFPTPEDYIAWATQRVKDLKKAFPKMKFAVPVANSLTTGAIEQLLGGASEHYIDWNKKIHANKAAIGYDFIIVHFYQQGKPQHHDGATDYQSYMDYGFSRYQTFNSEFVEDNLFKYYTENFPGTPILLTEWSGSNGVEYAGGSLLRALGGLKMMMFFQKLNQKYGNVIKQATYQVPLAPTGNGLIFPNKNGDPNITNTTEWNVAVEYFVFEMLRSFEGAKVLDTSHGDYENSVVEFMALEKGGKKFLFYTNASDTDFSISLDVVGGKMIKGQSLHSSNGTNAGTAAFGQPLELVERRVPNGNFMPAYSFGYLEVQ